MISKELIDYLIELDKIFKDNNISLDGCSLNVVIAKESGEEFILDISNGHKYSNRFVLNLRHPRHNVILFRLEMDGKPHMNPDGSITDRDHVHLWLCKEGELIFWGVSLQDFQELLLSNQATKSEVFEEFCRYTHIGNTEYQIGMW